MLSLLLLLLLLLVLLLLFLFLLLRLVLLLLLSMFVLVPLFVGQNPAPWLWPGCKQLLRPGAVSEIARGHRCLGWVRIRLPCDLVLV